MLTTVQPYSRAISLVRSVDALSIRITSFGWIDCSWMERSVRAIVVSSFFERTMTLIVESRELTGSITCPIQSWNESSDQSAHVKGASHRPGSGRLDGRSPDK